MDVDKDAHDQAEDQGVKFQRNGWTLIQNLTGQK